MFSFLLLLAGLTRRIDFSKCNCCLFHYFFFLLIDTYLKVSIYFHLGGFIITDGNALQDAKPLSIVRLDISASSIHTKRRIWQESITALLLTSPEGHIPSNQPMAFAQARDSEYPPYLLGFMGTPAERHVENLKVSHNLIVSPLVAYTFARFCEMLVRLLLTGLLL